jgi:heat shock protein HslJ
MKILLGLFSLLLPVLLLVVPGCNGAIDEITADLGQQVELKPRETAAINGQPIKVKFSEVVNDSRCPEGAACIWQGEITITVEITYDGNLYTKTLVQPGLSQSPAEDYFQEYNLSFNIQPYPKVGSEIKSADYRLQLTVSRKLQFEDTQLYLKSYGESGKLKNVLPDTEITATFDSDNDRVSGSAGCNSYGGAYGINGSQITISELASTKKACLLPGVMEQEQLFLSLMQSAQSFETSITAFTINCANNQQLVFSTTGGK